LGAGLISPNRAMEALKELFPLKDEFDLVTYPQKMGEDEAVECGFSPIVLGEIDSEQTSSKDTLSAAREMMEFGVDLIVFVGGDGTARDIFEAVNDNAVVLGIPSGVKIHSSVYAVNPRRGAELVKMFLKGLTQVREMEVMDIDEDLFRKGQVSARLYGYLQVPYSRGYIQSAKAGSFGSGNLSSIAEAVVDDMIDDYYYILGPGSTVKAIGDELKIEKTLLGVDVVFQRQLIGKDLNEQQLLDLIDGKKVKIVVTIIGGQGYIFGRGNQQISPRVIKLVGKKNLIVIATKDKLLSLDGPLLVDTGDSDCDNSLSGYIRVTTGYNEESLWKVEC
jgi:predicted polyphosphate/ATP-dependent NAD kinase